MHSLPYISLSRGNSERSRLLALSSSSGIGVNPAARVDRNQEIGQWGKAQGCKEEREKRAVGGSQAGQGGGRDRGCANSHGGDLGE